MIPLADGFEILLEALPPHQAYLHVGYVMYRAFMRNVIGGVKEGNQHWQVGRSVRRKGQRSEVAQLGQSLLCGPFKERTTRFVGLVEPVGAAT